MRVVSIIIIIIAVDVVVVVVVVGFAWQQPRLESLAELNFKFALSLSQFATFIKFESFFLFK